MPIGSATVSNRVLESWNSWHGLVELTLEPGCLGMSIPLMMQRRYGTGVATRFCGCMKLNLNRVSVQATKLDPLYSKAWARLASAHDVSHFLALSPPSHLRS
jgi:hypothetical protein